MDGSISATVDGPGCERNAAEQRHRQLTVGVLDTGRNSLDDWAADRREERVRDCREGGERGETARRDIDLPHQIPSAIRHVDLVRNDHKAERVRATHDRREGRQGVGNVVGEVRHQLDINGVAPVV